MNIVILAGGVGKKVVAFGKKKIIPSNFSCVGKKPLVKNFDFAKNLRRKKDFSPLPWFIAVFKKFSQNCQPQFIVEPARHRSAMGLAQNYFTISGRANGFDRRIIYRGY